MSYKYNNLTPFKWCVIQNFPFIEADFDAITNYQLFCKVVEYLNKTIDSTNILGQKVQEFAEYFDNLDVQEEINKKLDDLVKDGTLTNLIEKYINPYLENQDNKINEIDLKVTSATNGSPLVANSISEMTNTSKIYVLTTDGNWYYYNGAEWTSGGVYQATQIADDSVSYYMLEKLLQNVFNYKLERQELDFSLNGYISKETGMLAEGQVGKTAKYEVTPGEYYIVDGWALGNSRLVIMLNENSEILGSNYMIPEKSVFLSEYTHFNQVIRIPSECKYLYILRCSGQNYNVTTLSKIVGYSIKDLDNIMNKLFIQNLVDIKNYIQWNSGTTPTENDDGSIDFINLGTTEKYGGFLYQLTNEQFFDITKKVNIYLDTSILLGKWQYQIYGRIGESNTQIGFGNINGKQYLEFQPDSKYTSYWILIFSSVPSSSIKLKEIKSSQFNIDDINKSALELLDNKTIEDTNYEYEIVELQKFNINEQLKNDFKWSSAINNAKYAVFTFDDTNSDISTILELFKSKNVPVCFATIPSKLNNICADGRTAKEVLIDCVNNGGEVLSHWGSPLTSESSETDYYNIYVLSKKLLENEGFNVNGIITAGGTNYNTQNFEKDIELARNNYFYADLTATGFASIEQYYNRRNFIDAGVASIKSLIDNYVNKTGTQPYSKWLNFASHGTNTNTIEEFEEIIDYCLSNNIQIVTWKTLYDTFRSSKLEERIKLLEQ